MRVLTICHAKLMQSTALEQKRFNLRSLLPALHNLWLLLVLSIILLYVFSIKCSKLTGAFAQDPLRIDPLPVQVT